MAGLESGLWEGCRVEVVPETGESSFDDDDCDVRLEGDRLVVTYWDDDGVVVFDGSRDADGVFDLWCRSRPRRAELRFSPETRALAGSWTQEENRGTMRIVLSDDPR
jgi:hypothetical protein